MWDASGLNPLCAPPLPHSGLRRHFLAEIERLSVCLPTDWVYALSTYEVYTMSRVGLLVGWRGVGSAGVPQLRLRTEPVHPHSHTAGYLLCGSGCQFRLYEGLFWPKLMLRRHFPAEIERRSVRMTLCLPTDWVYGLSTDGVYTMSRAVLLVGWRGVRAAGDPQLRLKTQSLRSPSTQWAS